MRDHNYEAMYNFEIGNRKSFFYPPFSRIIQIVCRHKEKYIAEEAANILAQSLTKLYGQYISGPAEPPVNRVRNQYIFELLLKLPKDAKFLQNCKAFILQQIAIIQSQKQYRSVTMIADVDAM